MKILSVSVLLNMLLRRFAQAATGQHSNRETNAARTSPLLFSLHGAYFESADNESLGHASSCYDDSHINFDVPGSAFKLKCQGCHCRIKFENILIFIRHMICDYQRVRGIPAPINRRTLQLVRRIVQDTSAEFLVFSLCLPPEKLELFRAYCLNELAACGSASDDGPKHSKSLRSGNSKIPEVLSLEKSLVAAIENWDAIDACVLRECRLENSATEALKCDFTGLAMRDRIKCAQHIFQICTGETALSPSTKTFLISRIVLLLNPPSFDVNRSLIRALNKIISSRQDVQSPAIEHIYENLIPDVKNKIYFELQLIFRIFARRGGDGTHPKYGCGNKNRAKENANGQGNNVCIPTSGVSGQHLGAYHQPAIAWFLPAYHLSTPQVGPRNAQYSPNTPLSSSHAYARNENFTIIYETCKRYGIYRGVSFYNIRDFINKVTLMLDQSEDRAESVLSFNWCVSCLLSRYLSTKPFLTQLPNFIVMIKANPYIASLRLLVEKHLLVRIRMTSLIGAIKEIRSNSLIDKTLVYDHIFDWFKGKGNGDEIDIIAQAFEHTHNFISRMYIVYKMIECGMLLHSRHQFYIEELLKKTVLYAGDYVIGYALYICKHLEENTFYNIKSHLDEYANNFLSFHNHVTRYKKSAERIPIALRKVYGLNIYICELLKGIGLYREYSDRLELGFTCLEHSYIINGLIRTIDSNQKFDNYDAKKPSADTGGAGILSSNGKNSSQLGCSAAKHNITQLPGNSVHSDGIHVPNSSCIPVLNQSPTWIGKCTESALKIMLKRELFEGCPLPYYRHKRLYIIERSVIYFIKQRISIKEVYTDYFFYSEHSVPFLIFEYVREIIYVNFIKKNAPTTREHGDCECYEPKDGLCDAEDPVDMMDDLDGVFRCDSTGDSRDSSRSSDSSDGIDYRNTAKGGNSAKDSETASLTGQKGRCTKGHVTRILKDFKRDKLGDLNRLRLKSEFKKAMFSFVNEFGSMELYTRLDAHDAQHRFLTVKIIKRILVAYVGSTEHRQRKKEEISGLELLCAMEALFPIEALSSKANLMRNLLSE